MKKRKIALCFAMVLSFSLFVTACGNSSNGSNSETDSANNNIIATEGSDETSYETDESPKTANNISSFSEIFNPTERTIWYEVSEFAKDDDVHSILVAENGTLTIYNTRNQFTLGDVAKMNDDEIVSSLDNSDNYVKYDLSKKIIDIFTDNSGNNIVREDMYLPMESIIAFSKPSDTSIMQGNFRGYPLSFNAITGKFMTEKGTIYESNYEGLRNNYHDNGSSKGYLIITRTASSIHDFPTDSLSLSGALIDDEMEHFSSYNASGYNGDYIEFTGLDGYKYYFENQKTAEGKYVFDETMKISNTGNRVTKAISSAFGDTDIPAEEPTPEE